MNSGLDIVMGTEKLVRVTLICPRSEYEELSRKVADFSYFHVEKQEEYIIDSKLQELSSKAVRLYALAEQTARDLGLQLAPGAIDLLFKGVKISRTEFSAKDWDELLTKAESMISPVALKVQEIKSEMQNIQKQKEEYKAILDLLSLLSQFPIELSRIKKLKLLRAELLIVQSKSLNEFLNSLQEEIKVVRKLTNEYSAVLVCYIPSEEQRVERVIKAFNARSVSIPQDVPQNTMQAVEQIRAKIQEIEKREVELARELLEIARSDGEKILSVLELADTCRDTLDQVRSSGRLRRFSTLSGYIPVRLEKSFESKFSPWIVYKDFNAKNEDAPTLINNPGVIRAFETLTKEQGIPSHHEVDPTPIISFVFPVFFGLMFGDFGHGLVLTLFSLLLIMRGVGNIREWGKIFLASGISACFFGAIFGEFFGFSLHSILPLPTVIELVQRPPVVQNATLNPDGVILVIVISIMIGAAHLLTALALNIVESVRAGESIELITESIPAFIMYVGGIFFGFAFLGAGYTFNILSVTKPVPLLNLQTNTVGLISLILLFGSMLTIMFGKTVAILAGKLKGESISGSLGLGALEVFERILQFSANTISYVRLGVMLLIHASLLIIVNTYTPITNPAMIVPWVFFNILIIAFEALVVYVQDLRLHVYEFFTKFYEGNGIPFRRLFPDKIRFRVSWG